MSKRRAGALLSTYTVQPPLETDVAIIGAGIAGLSAAVLLRRAGLGVVCIDAVRPVQRRVGESLDWSSPGLLGRMASRPTA